jgi:transposase
MNNIIHQSIGIDISNDDFHACFYQKSLRGQMKRKGKVRTFKNTLSGFDDLINWIEKVRDASSVGVSIVMEATGVYHEQLAYFAHEKAYRLSVLLPNKVKSFAKSLNILSKTDKIDAEVLARMGVERPLRSWSPMSPLMRDLKALSRQRQAFIKQKIALANQLHADEKRAKPVKNNIKRGRKMIATYKKEIAVIEKEMKELLVEDEQLKVSVQRLCTVPGVAFITAATVLAETDGLVLFTRESQLIKYCGYDVKLKDSGTSVHGRMCISKAGNSHIRGALYMPSMSAMQLEGPFRECYFRVVDRTGHGKMGLVAVQRKMLKIMYACHKKGEDFDPSYTKTRA